MIVDPIEANVHLLLRAAPVSIGEVLDIRKLHMLAELDRLGTLAAVARSLQLTAPGVSMQLAALEREVRLKLTERHGRTVSLTPAGRLLAQHAHGIVERLSLAETEAAALRDGAAGTYRVAAFPAAARTIVADAWRTILDNPDLGLRLELTELEPPDSLPAIARGEVELAITHGYSNVPAQDATDLVVTRLATENVYLAIRATGGPDAGDVGSAINDAPGAPVDLGSFARHPWVVPHRRWSCYEMVRRACGLAGFEPRAVAEATDFAVILSLVAAGAGVALVPELAIATLPAGVALHLLVAPVHRHDFVVTRPSTDADPGIRRLRKLFVASANRLAPPAQR